MKPKRAIVWGVGIIVVVAIGLYGEFVRETREHDPSLLLACAEVDPPLTAWTCKQMLLHDSLRPEQVAQLNREAGARYPVLAKDPALAEEMLTLFISRGVDVNAVDQNFKGWTALYGIAAGGDVERVKMLLKHGARADVRATDGMSLLDYARQVQEKFPNEPNRAEVVRLLESAKGAG